MPNASLTWTTVDRVPVQADTPLTWMTAHRLRFDRPVDAKTGGIAGPVGASLALIGPDSRLDANGMRESFSDTWGGIAFYADRAAAEAAMDDPMTIPACNDAAEAWHGLLCPISHRGETAWFGDLKKCQTFCSRRARR